ncbi:MAG TPA: GNAT family N-acetyltransferase [Chthoniobacteraceae bacterium]|nr:GNAT family N-acetyltransferase [Chthoniobacteraceae bacterium]
MTPPDTASAPCFQPLHERWIASACRLSTQAGWNQNEEDWRRLARVAPEGVKVWVDGGEVRASYSVVAYGRESAWIGMILVDHYYRGKGLGKAAFVAAMEEARARDVAVIGLDATELGEPIYRKFGFGITLPLTRWGGVLHPAENAASEGSVRHGWSDQLPGFDASLSGADRSALLRDFARSDATLLYTETDGKLTGYAVLRPGRSAFHLGPVVADAPETFDLLLSEAASRLAGASVLCDAIDPAASASLERHGLLPLRHLKRMTLPEAPGCLCGPGVRLAVGFEWG